MEIKQLILFEHKFEEHTYRFMIPNGAPIHEILRFLEATIENVKTYQTPPAQPPVDAPAAPVDGEASADRPVDGEEHAS